MSSKLPFSLRPAALALTIAFSGIASASDLQITPQGQYFLDTTSFEEVGDPTRDLTISVTGGVPTIGLTAQDPGAQALIVHANNLTLLTFEDAALRPGDSMPVDTIRLVNNSAFQGLGCFSALDLKATNDISISMTGVNMEHSAAERLSAIYVDKGSTQALISGKNIDVSAKADGDRPVRGIYSNTKENVSLGAKDKLTFSVRGNGFTAGVDMTGDGGTLALGADGDLSVEASTAGADSSVYGIHVYDTNKASVLGKARVNIVAEAEQSGHAVALFAERDATLQVNAQEGLSLLATTDGNRLGQAIINAGGDVDVFSPGADNQITGDVVNLNQGTMLMSLGGGLFTGRIINTAHNWTNNALVSAVDDGLSIVTFNNVNWQNPGNSDVTLLLSEGSTIEMKGKSYNRLTLGAFNGNGNTFVLRANMQSESVGNPTLDVVEINDVIPVDINDPNKQYNTTNKVKVVMINAPGADSDKMYAANPSIINNNTHLTMTLETEGGYVNGSTDRWVLRYADDAADLDTENPADTLGTTGGKGNWYLVRIRAAKDTSEGNMVQTLGTGLTGYLTYRNELDMLGDRLSSVRQTGDTGLWVRASGDKAHAKGAGGLSFKQSDVSLTIGADGKVWQAGERKLHAGGAFKAGKSKLDGAAAKADVNHYSLKGYATMMNANGAYVDAVLQTGVYTHDMKGRSNTGQQSVTGDYNTFGFGASLEAGHRFGFAKNFFAEPSMQLSWFHLKGRDCTLSTGMKAVAGSADFVTGRLGMMAGWASVNGTAGTSDFSRKALAVRTGLNRDFRAKQNVVTGDVTEKLNARGTSVYYGLEGTWTQGNTSLFAVVDREEGNKYRRDFGVTAGVRYQF